jgi:hypothetical protein
MKEENEINREVKQLLDSLEQHGQNARRQQELSDLIDKLSSGTSLRGGTTKQSRREADTLDCFVPRKSKIRRSQCAKRVQDSTNDAKRPKLFPLWLAIGAAAACLLLWLLVKPTVNETPKADEKILVEEMETVSPAQSNTNDVLFEKPVAEEELIAEKTPPKQPGTQIQKENIRDGLLRSARKDEREEIVEANLKEPSNATEINDTMNIGSKTILTSAEEKLSTVNCQLSTNSSPQRRVIQSLNLVCYECQKAPEDNYQLSTINHEPEKTIFGQPQDPNMKNGSLAFELKLH